MIFYRRKNRAQKKVFIMIELSVFLLILVTGFIAFILGYAIKQTYFYLLGSVIIVLSGLSLYIFDGIILNRIVESVSDAGVISYSLISVDMTNPFLLAFALILVSVGVIALFLFAAQPSVQRKSVFHY